MKIQLTVAFMIMLSHMLIAGSPKREINLRGKWYFELGDIPAYAEADFDHSHWEKVRVPAPWEDQGFPGYDGYAWYRRTFRVPEKLQKKSLTLALGYIDDVDQVYINGQFLNGRGIDAPHYVSAYNQRRLYQIPGNLLKYGDDNVIAVRVYDDWGEGGIVSGKVGIYSQQSSGTTVDLAGRWKFRSGDNPGWAVEDLDDSGWNTLVVPGRWEDQGYQDLDEYAWYRTEIILPKTMEDEKLILYIGAIDDADELYINGKKISSKGKFPGENFREYNRRFYNHERFYYIPGHVLQPGEKNVIAIRVWDSGGDGGIYRGPVGITTRQEYRKFRKSHHYHHSNFSYFLNDLLD
ncbi:beta galactosidase jelly roll domain-containing protein [bacterium]|nr:beta galactosidase jelly roll domain-containing protein [bacterium]